MIAHQNFSGTFITYVLGVFYPTASATAYGQRPKVKIAPTVQHCINLSFAVWAKPEMFFSFVAVYLKIIIQG